MGVQITTKSSISPNLIILLLFTKVKTQSTYLCDEDDDDDKQNFCHPKHWGHETTPKHLMIVLKCKPTYPFMMSEWILWWQVVKWMESIYVFHISGPHYC